MRTLTIGLAAEHAGLIELLAELWQGMGHVVHLYPKWPNFPSPFDGTEDIIVSTLPYRLDQLETGKPTIVYYTDPIWPDTQKKIQELFNDKKVRVIGAEDCYMPQHFPDGVTEFIPFALNPKNYPVYTGVKKEVAIINRKPEERWKEVIRGATGVYMPLEQYLEGIPYKIITIENQGSFRKAYAEHKVLFYFSNSPYTIVMFEAMTVGMPVVAFNHHHLAKYHPIERYLHPYSIERDQIRKWLIEYLEGPELPPQTYPSLHKFEVIQSMWQKVFEEMT